MQARIRSDNEILTAFRNILIKHPDIPQNDYDRLNMPIEEHPARSTLKRRFGTWADAKHKALNPTEVAPATEEQSVIPPDTEQLASRTHLLAQNERLMRDIERQRHLNQVFVENCLAAIEKMQVKPIAVKPRVADTVRDLEFHALRSDAQVGQKTDSRLVQGLASYSSDIYRERVKRWTDKVLLFREQDRRSLGLSRLIVHCLGDQVEGESIYPGQPFYLDLNLTEQLFFSVETEASALLALAKEFSEVDVFTVSGNHGRMGKKGDHSVQANIDFIFYRSLKAALANQPNIHFYISESPSMLVRHGNFHFLLNHGDSAKSWAGIPFYGLERMYSRLANLYGMKVDVELVGHHHQPCNLSGRLLMNGCLPGGSDLSVNRMSVSSIPSQKIFYFHNEHGMNRETDLHLADPVVLEADERGIYTSVVE